jgi:hypothetical protein
LGPSWRDLELECSYTLGRPMADNYWIPSMNKTRWTAQALARVTPIYLHAERQTAYQNHFFVFRGLKMCKSVKISTSDFSQSQYLLVLYITHMRNWKLVGKRRTGPLLRFWRRFAVLRKRTRISNIRNKNNFLSHIQTYINFACIEVWVIAYSSGGQIKKSFLYFNIRHLVPSHHIIQQSIFIHSGVINFIVGIGNLTCFDLY